MASLSNTPREWVFLCGSGHPQEAQELQEEDERERMLDDEVFLRGPVRPAAV
jgi:hypothetical protein